jgi:hypothetical protein
MLVSITRAVVLAGAAGQRKLYRSGRYRTWSRHSSGELHSTGHRADDRFDVPAGAECAGRPKAGAGAKTVGRIAGGWNAALAWAAAFIDEIGRGMRRLLPRARSPTGRARAWEEQADASASERRRWWASPHQRDRHRLERAARLVRGVHRRDRAREVAQRIAEGRLGAPRARRARGGGIRREQPVSIRSILVRP